MDIPNLTTSPLTQPEKFRFSVPAILIVTLMAVSSGFWLSRLTSAPGSSSLNTVSLGSPKITAEVSSSSQIEVGQVYGNTTHTFKDTASGTIEKGDINGEGTHILIRTGGASQRASLISSNLDLDLFVGRKVEVQGETNRSNKTSWLLDVGQIKVLE